MCGVGLLHMESSSEYITAGLMVPSKLILHLCVIKRELRPEPQIQHRQVKANCGLHSAFERTDKNASVIPTVVPLGCL